MKVNDCLFIAMWSEHLNNSIVTTYTILFIIDSYNKASKCAGIGRISYINLFIIFGIMFVAYLPGKNDSMTCCYSQLSSASLVNDLQTGCVALALWPERLLWHNSFRVRE